MLTGITKLLLEELERRHMPVAEFGKLAALEGIRNASKTKLNEYFRARLRFRETRLNNCGHLMAEITSYVDAMPVPVALRDADEIKHILDQRREATKIFEEIVAEK